ncbi:MAG: ABC transporter substrate-binding protein [Opitutaceae bacterium]|jgi:iron complex transport system substrate-binding protein|nr:ABC transporter substrate-binding protein [Opitutaceae bacterium]
MAVLNLPRSPGMVVRLQTKTVEHAPWAGWLAALAVCWICWIAFAGRGTVAVAATEGTGGTSAPASLAATARVVSQTVGTDELLLAVAAPEQIAALSHLAGDAAFSGVSGAVANGRFPLLSKNGDAESVLRHRPTLVLCADYSRVELVEQVRRSGVKVLIFGKYKTLDDSYANLRLLARELGPAAEARAERVIADCEARVAELRRRLAGVRLVRVIAPSTYGLIPGRDTTFQDLCDHAAGENLAATLGGLRGHDAPPAEKMLTWPVEMVVLPGDGVDAALAPFVTLPPYKFMAAVKKRRVALVESWQLGCVSHLRVQGYEKLAWSLHPARFDHPQRGTGILPVDGEAAGSTWRGRPARSGSGTGFQPVMEGIADQNQNQNQHQNQDQNQNQNQEPGRRIDITTTRPGPLVFSGITGRWMCFSPSPAPPRPAPSVPPPPPPSLSRAYVRR